MLAKYTIAALAGSAMLAGAAFAQSPAATTTDKQSPAATTTDKAGMAPAASSTTSMSYTGDWRASKMAGLNVYNDNNENVGSINDLLLDKSGNVKAVVIGVGGFLGVGEHLVAVSFDKVKFVTEPVAYTGASATKPASTTTTGAATTTTTTTTAPAATTTTSSKANPWYPDHAVFNATKDELKAMPEFKYTTN